MCARVIVAMSGGVDSSTAAALLIKQGYSVTGVMLRLCHVGDDENTKDAQSIADKLCIPIHINDQFKLFKKTIIKPFISSYIKGETPNPCIQCNPLIKWSSLMDWMRKLSADYVATGHYARIRNTPDGNQQLLQAVDMKKDQSYVLSHLSQNYLKHTLFPLGDITKEEVRSMAYDLGLNTAYKEESQDLCFLNHTDYRSFIISHASAELKGGNITDKTGEVIGKHQGLAFYTIGQRKGLGIFSERPLYVIHKDISTNTLVVGFKEDLGSDELIAGPCNWIAGKAPAENFTAQVKIRYQADPVDASVQIWKEGFARARFNKPLRDITQGQYAVFYDGEVVLGGGKIINNGIKLQQRE